MPQPAVNFLGLKPPKVQIDLTKFKEELERQLKQTNGIDKTNTVLRAQIQIIKACIQSVEWEEAIVGKDKKIDPASTYTRKIYTERRRWQAALSKTKLELIDMWIDKSLAYLKEVIDKQSAAQPEAPTQVHQSNSP